MKCTISSRAVGVVIAATAGFVVMAAAARPSAPAQIIPNDDGDDTAAVQAYLDSLKGPGATGVPPLPAGRILISDTLQVVKSMGMAIRGSGGSNHSRSPGWDRFRSGTVLVWQGPPDKPMLELVGCGGMVIEGVNFECSSGNSADSAEADDNRAAQGILIRHGAGSLGFAFRDLAFMGPVVGIQCGSFETERTCANVTYDSLHFRDCDVGLKIVNMQSPEHLLLRPEFTYCDVAIDVEAGGDVTVVGGGSYQLGTMLRLGNIRSNNRGFEILSHRFDGLSSAGNKRTRWLDFVNERELRTYGTVVFQSCTQITNQRESEFPLVEVAPGSRVVLRECGFNHHAHADYREGNLAHLFSSNKGVAELHVLQCDGIGAGTEYLTLEGPQAFYRFVDVGSMRSPSTSLTNIDPPKESQVLDSTKERSATQFTDEEAAALRALLRR